MTPRVSVIVAARDAAATLPETLASVRAQTFDDWEIVVVDDGSGDDTAAIAQATPRTTTISHQSARGPAAARNRAADEARGELLATLDSDDSWLPDYLASQVAAYDAAAAAGRNVGLVCCDAELLGPGGPTGRRWSDVVGPIGAIDLTALLRENLVYTSVLLPRSVFEEVGGYADEQELMGVEDYDLWLRIAGTGREIVFNDRTLARYRVGATSLSTQVERMARRSQRVLDRALASGTLTRRQRRVAKRQRRVFGVVAARARIGAEPRRARKLALAAKAAPLAAVAAAEHPERWAHWLRRGVRPAGEGRHSGLHA